VRVRIQLGVITTIMDDGGLVVLSERSGKLYRCNTTAAALWEALRLHDGSPEVAAEDVAHRYHVDVERVAGDLDTLLTALRQADLVRTEP
jgi:hypothetical protein